MTYEEKLAQFAEAVLVDIDRERAWYQTPAGHMRTVCDPRYPYSVCLRLLRDASHLEIDMGEVEQHYKARCLASLPTQPKIWEEKTYTPTQEE